MTTREFRAYEYVDGDKKLYVRLEGQGDDAWEELGTVKWGDRRSTRELALAFGLSELNEAENQRLVNVIIDPKRW